MSVQLPNVGIKPLCVHQCWSNTGSIIYLDSPYPFADSFGYEKGKDIIVNPLTQYRLNVKFLHYLQLHSPDVVPRLAAMKLNLR
jgi:hypothetical protein